MTRTARVCEGCGQKVSARFRALLNLFLCQSCYSLWQSTGEVPTPMPLMEDPTRW